LIQVNERKEKNLDTAAILDINRGSFKKRTW